MNLNAKFVNLNVSFKKEEKYGGHATFATSNCDKWRKQTTNFGDLPEGVGLHYKKHV